MGTTRLKTPRELIATLAALPNQDVPMTRSELFTAAREMGKTPIREMVMACETLNHYGMGGGIHFCWQDVKGNATGRPVTDEQVRQWMEQTDDGRHFKSRGYRLVHLPEYAGPCIVPDVRRVDAWTLSLEGSEYHVSGAVMPDGKVNYHDLRVVSEVRGREVVVENYSIKHSLLEYINNEEALEKQR